MRACVFVSACVCAFVCWGGGTAAAVERRLKNGQSGNLAKGSN